MISVGELYYNGFYFPGAITAKVTMTPVPDTSGRYVKYRQLTINVEFIVFPGCDEFTSTRTHPVTGATYNPVFPNPSSPYGSSGIDGVDAQHGIRALRRMLTENGGILKFIDKGFGTEMVVGPTILTGITHPDLDFGPKVTSFSFEPLGSNCGARVIWECTATIADCETPSGTFDVNAAEYSYTVAWNINSDGTQTKTVSGSIEIPVFRVGNLINRSADVYRSRIRFEVPLGFIRQSQNWNLSTDRKTLSFTIVDKELESDNPYDRGVIDCQVTETMVSNGQIIISLTPWDFAFDGTIKIAKGFPRWLAWSAFVRVVNDRVQHLRLNAKNAVKEVDGFIVADDDKLENTPMVFLKSVRISEEIYGRGMSFALSFGTTCHLNLAIRASGLWKPVPLNYDSNGEPNTNNAWAKWREELADKITNVRGYYGLYHNSSTDTIVSVCDQDQVVDLAYQPTEGDNPGYIPTYGNTLPDKVSQSRPYNDLDENPLEPSIPPDQRGILNFPPPTADKSWISYHPVVELIEDVPVVVHRAITGADTYNSDILDESVDPSQEYNQSTNTNPTGLNINIDDSAPLPIIQHRGQTIWLVRFTGTAVRHGFRIPRPTLVSYAGIPVYRYRDMVFETKIISVADNNSKMYMARWHGLYVLQGHPQKNEQGLFGITKPDERQFKSGK